MVDIQSKEVIDKMSEDLKVQPAMQLPRELGKQILPVYKVNPPREVQVRVNAATDAASATIFTTHATKDTFLIAAQLTTAKDVNSTSKNSSIRGTPFGKVDVALMINNYEPTTAGQFNIYVPLPMPIKLARNTAVTLNNSTAVASIDTFGVIYFYEVDPQ